MPATRKKVLKTVYKDENDSEEDNAIGDFSDSGSEAEIPEDSSSDEDAEPDPSSADEFDEEYKKKKKFPQVKRVKKPKFAKEFIGKINRQTIAGDEQNIPVMFSIKDLTEEDKLLPSVLDLSESDSSSDESPKVPTKKQSTAASISTQKTQSDSETETNTEYKDVWAKNLRDNSDEIAKKTFMELEQHKNKIEETKASISNYTSSKVFQEGEAAVKDLLAQGEELLFPSAPVSQKKGRQTREVKDDSDSEMDDWEEVKETKSIPQQGIQLTVDFPEAGCRKSKKLDIEMMMKRKINRVKKEYQVYMHKVHVLCWLGHGNYVSKVLNDQEVLAAALSLVPGKECYPGERVDIKYLEQITTWYKDKLALKQDKNEDKFRPKAPPLKDVLLSQILKRVVTTKKYLVFIFVSMLRAIGLQCRVMFNFVTLPIRPPSSELCSLSVKPKDEKTNTNSKEPVKKEAVDKDQEKNKTSARKTKVKGKLPQVDGNYDSSCSSDEELDNLMQLDGNDDLPINRKSVRTTRTKKNMDSHNEENEDVSPPKRARKGQGPKTTKTESKNLKGKRTISKDSGESKTAVTEDTKRNATKSPVKTSTSEQMKKEITSKNHLLEMDVDDSKVPSPQKTKTTNKGTSSKYAKTSNLKVKLINSPKLIKTDVQNKESDTASEYFGGGKSTDNKTSLSLRRRRTQFVEPESTGKSDDKVTKRTARAKIAQENVETSKYFQGETNGTKSTRNPIVTKKEAAQEDKRRVSHRDLLAKNKAKPKNDITGDLVDIIKKRVKEAKVDSKKGIVKGKIKQESDEDSDHLPVETHKRRKSDSDEDFKPTKISPRPSTSRVAAVKKIDRRVLSSDTEEAPKNRTDVWCEVFVEELEQWIAVDVIRAKVHCTNEIYKHATQPVCYVVGWDNNNYLKDLTRRYVPHWNTVTRKQRAEPAWWDAAVKPWLGPRSPRDREEDEQLNRMQLEAPLPKSIAEYKNHPLYALKRHLLKFEAIYPPDAATLGFVRSEPVYARECVYICRSRDTWLKEARVVKPAEQPYKIVKARPKWDKLSNKMITDKPLELFGPWQTQPYEPPLAENGIVPRNAYGNVELFKDCMLPKGTVHIKLPGLNRVAKKLNIDCAPAMTGFDFNGGWSHPVYDGFVVCKEFEEVITEAWLKDQEDQERREREKIEARVYGNWRRLIKGLFIRERLKAKYGFDDPPAPPAKRNKGPRLVTKKK